MTFFASVSHSDSLCILIAIVAHTVFLYKKIMYLENNHKQSKMSNDAKGMDFS